MNWKNDLKKLEDTKNWDFAINLMQKIIIEDSSVDVYLMFNYLLMNLLVEEDYDRSSHEYYAKLLEKNFLESFSKFSNNPEYLFFTGMTAFMSEWYFNIEIEDAEKMLQTAMQLEPSNVLYKWGYYGLLKVEKNEEDKKKAMPYAKLILDVNSPIKKALETKGSLGEYILEIMSGWSKSVLMI